MGVLYPYDYQTKKSQRTGKTLAATVIGVNGVIIIIIGVTGAADSG